MNILFSGNDRVFDGVLTCMLSILKRTEVKEPFSFYVMTMDVSHLKPEYVPISEARISYLDMIAKRYHEQNRVIRLDVTELYQQEFANSPNEQCYCSPYTLLRLFLDMIPDIPDKMLYLDVDIMFNRDIALLYNHDVTEYEYAAARDHYGKYLLNPNYINAGVLLFNVKKIKETGLLVKARKLIKTKKLMFADQDAIYKSTTKKLMLPQYFNDQKFLHKHTVVRHFSKRLFYFPYPHTENVKQWQLSRMYRLFGYTQFDDILYEYLYWKGKYEHEMES
ncbi:MAG: lipopolysaccharide biosynthesis protein [Lachnospiraceae bacterium]|nr:lipopolysaccharide biosynthesis protein [Lachnospiraceae bacterium]